MTGGCGRRFGRLLIGALVCQFLSVDNVVCAADVRGDEAGGSAADVDFSRDVLPLLTEYCFACHGPDSKTRTSELFASWKSWAQQAEEPIGSMKRFSQNIEAKGYRKHRMNDGKSGFVGLSPKAEYEWKETL